MNIVIAFLEFIESLLYNEDVWLFLFYLGLFVFLIYRIPRLSRYRIFGFYGLCAVIIGGGLLFCLTPAGVKTFHDLLELGGFFLLFAVIAVVGILVMKTAFSASRRQKHFEREVDRFHDAWKSRNERW